MPLDRSIPPSFTLPSEFKLTSPQEFHLKNGAALYFCSTPGIAAVKLEVIGKSGRGILPLKQALVPSFTLQLLQEGTHRATSQELAEFFDFYASEVYPYLSYSQEGLTLLCIKKHLFTLLPNFLSLFTEASFPEEPLEKKKSQRKLSLQLEREKSASRASQIFKTALFGPEHPIGQEINEAHIDLLTPELLKAYYSDSLWRETNLFLCGDFSAQELDALLPYLEQLPCRAGVPSEKLPSPQSTASKHEEREEALQSSIRLGGWSLPKTHSDYPALSVFNTLLGGYFGSRLIKNIREEKGLTYGISSSLAEVNDYAYWIIAADVKKVHREEVFEEIHKEIKLLCEEAVDAEELEVLRNYLIGQLFTRFSSPFDLIDQFKAVHFSGLDFKFYESRLDFLKSFTAEDLLRIGKAYFSDPSRVQVSVG